MDASLKSAEAQLNQLDSATGLKKGDPFAAAASLQELYRQGQGDTKRMLVEMGAAAKFNATFRLPKSEKLLAEYVCSFWKAHSGKYCKGRLCLSPNYVSFHSELTVPNNPARTSSSELRSKRFRYQECQGGKLRATGACIYAHIIQAHTPVCEDRKMACEQIDAIRQNCDLIEGDVFRSLHQFFTDGAQTRPISEDPLGITSLPDYSSGIAPSDDIEFEILQAFNRVDAEVALRYGEGIVNDNYSLSPDYGKKQWKQERDIQDYFRKNSSGCSVIIRYRPLFAILQAGIPDRLRGRQWGYHCGALAKSQSYPNDYYLSLLEDNKDKPSLAREEIEKDLHRSFPEHPMFITGGGLIENLRRMLVAYSWRNPEIGYCQSMNIVASLLLLFMNEEEAFWIMASLCEDMVPEYYRKTMLGSMVDQKILDGLIKAKLPAIHNHLTELQVPIAVLTMPWFLCLFIGYIPLETTLRLLDSFFYAGPNILFQMALTLLKINEAKILGEEHGEMIVMLLKESRYNIGMVMEVFQSFADLPCDLIQEARNAHKMEMVKHIETTNRNKAIRLAEQSTSLSRSELDALFQTFSSEVDPSSRFQWIDFDHFAHLWKVFVPHWELREAMWKRHCNEENQKMDFQAFATVLSLLLKQKFPALLELTFQLHCAPGQTALDVADVYKFLDAMIRVYVPEEHVVYQDVNGFVQKLFDACSKEARGGDSLSWQELKATIIDQSIWTSHLGLDIDALPRAVELDWTEIPGLDSSSGSGSGKYRVLSPSDASRSPAKNLRKTPT